MSIQINATWMGGGAYKYTQAPRIGALLTGFGAFGKNLIFCGSFKFYNFAGLLDPEGLAAAQVRSRTAALVPGPLNENPRSISRLAGWLAGWAGWLSGWIAWLGWIDG